jgi:putative phosphoribosyl transferase
MFKHRRHAGQQLAAALLKYRDEVPVVLALPRGGVPVAYEVAAALAAPLDVIVVRKLGALGQPELGIGAVVDGNAPLVVLNEDVAQALEVSQEYLEQQIALQLQEIRHREAHYRGGRPRVEIAGRTAILIDDGVATGGSMRAALRAVRRAQPQRVVLAIPVAPSETVTLLRAEADDVVCLSTPPHFHAVGEFYDDFRQTTDEEVIELLQAARAAG